MKARPFVIVRRSDQTGAECIIEPAAGFPTRAAAERARRDLQTAANAAGSEVTYRIAETLNPRGHLKSRP